MTKKSQLQEITLCFLMMITILLTTTGSNYVFVSAQQFDPNQIDTNNPSSDNISQIPVGTLPNDNQSQSFGDGGNQSTLIPESIRDNLDQIEVDSAGINGTQGPPGPQGEVGPSGINGTQGPPGQSGNNTTSKVNIYVNNGIQESTSDDSFVTTSAACIENDIPISGGYSIVKEDEVEDNYEVNAIESTPNLQNNSWTINVEGDNIQVTPYVLCLTVTE
ncbi:MAG: collagen-like protein [Nitrosopumilus sp.]|nr:collagen-like protein [Nitrosopumilus sp.]